ncbi:hypothetical protein GGR88_000634 [Sphingomonas jejuensis]|jgi:hypothetical protein|uniref:Uncharacterized protein n=1 Tax=Sphingomonas jejuensis TaxID=904715 RepID=A0ABX0XIU3_9SPHN|nr:hypothetical protein [Sphingomonas jejuensis]NJC33160.1 hypothetical protein [Sphingomonas jejuensis]
MNEDRLIAAFGRLDLALRRVEQVASTPSAGTADSGDPALQERHALLRSAASAALADLDSLIEKHTCRP